MPAAPALLTQADAPVALVRQVEGGQAAPGTRLQNGDMLEIAAGRMAQVEVPDASLVALQGPAHVVLDSLEAGPEGHVQLRVLEGWVKVQPMGNAAHPRVTIETPNARVAWHGGTALLHVEDGRTAVFAESAQVEVSPLDGARQAGATAAVASESFASRDGAQPVAVRARPDAEFLRSTPPALRDLLEPFGPRLHGPPPVLALQPAAYEQVEGWLLAGAGLRRGMVTRFQPRLRDPAFRAEVEAHLARLPDWREALHPPARQAGSGAQGTPPHAVIYLSPTDAPAYGVPASAGGDVHH